MANSRHRKIDPNFDSPLLFPLPIGFGIMNALPLRSASSASPLPLPFPSLQFLARFKAQLIPSFFVQLSCLFFAHMGAADGSSQETLFPHLAPVSAPKMLEAIIFCCQSKLHIRESPCGKNSPLRIQSFYPIPSALVRGPTVSDLLVLNVR